MWNDIKEIFCFLTFIWVTLFTEFFSLPLDLIIKKIQRRWNKIQKILNVQEAKKVSNDKASKEEVLKVIPTTQTTLQKTTSQKIIESPKHKKDASKRLKIMEEILET